jgi:hypothetical protein
MMANQAIVSALSKQNNTNAEIDVYSYPRGIRETTVHVVERVMTITALARASPVIGAVMRTTFTLKEILSAK